MKLQPDQRPEPADGFYSPRELTYIQPAGRRLSDYEAVICHVQPDVNHYDFGGWLLSAPDGRLLFEESSSQLRHPDWFEYRDPSSLWQRTYMRQQAMEERSVGTLIESARTNGSLDDLDRFWAREILARYYQGFAFAEWGLFLALNRAVRLALSDTLTMMLTFTAVDRLRHQQSIALFSLELEHELGGFPEGLGREAWMEDYAFQPARRVVERLMASEDWGEIAVVCGLLIDPLFSAVVMRHFIRRFASVNGDAITPGIAMAAERDRMRYQGAVKALLEMALADTDRAGRPVPAAANRAVLQDWVNQWAPPVLRAVDAFLPIYDLPTMRPEIGEVARSAVVSDCEGLLERFGLELPDDGASPMTAPERTTVGVCLMKSDEADAAIIHLRESAPEIRVEDHVTYFRVEAEHDLVIDLSEVAAYLGRDLSMSSFLVTLSAYFGEIDMNESVLTVSSVSMGKDRLLGGGDVAGA